LVANGQILSLETRLSHYQTELVAMNTNLKFVAYQLEAKKDLTDKLLLELHVAEMKMHQAVVTGGAL
jgi:hypothetical protein